MQTDTNNSVAQPTVLAIGYDPDSVLLHQCIGKVIFRRPEDIVLPDHIPKSVKRVIVSNRIAEHADGRRLENLARARSATFEQRGSGLITLREAIENELVAAVPQCDNGASRERILAVACKPGSIKEFLRDRILPPYDHLLLAKKLLPYVRKQFPDSVANRVSIGIQIQGILKDAGIIASQPPATPSVQKPKSPVTEAEEIRKLKERLEESTEREAALETALDKSRRELEALNRDKTNLERLLKKEQDAGRQNKILLANFRELSDRISRDT
jgi:hypothetical protein